MNKRFFKLIALFIVAFTIFSCATKKPVKPPVRKPNTVNPTTPAIRKEKEAEVVKVNLPEVNREFRGAWIATVANINWPSKNNLSTDQQKAEAIRLLDMLKDNNFNAVIFQARPSSDALYNSPYEPWSSFLTGETGRKPYPYYDPLEFWIDEAHKRGMELHVWLNPYRAYHTTGGTINSESMVRKMPNEVVKLRNGTYWFDPANQKTQDHVSAVVKDLVKRYDIDAIHFDDYFYPYAEYNGGKDFPDNKTWNEYKNSGGSLSRADWRRANVNKFVKRIYDEIHAEKSYVKFGISPFGIWKPGYPADVKGSSQYDELYADAKLWLNEGWIDYFAPQLYWRSDSPGQNFTSLLNWWNSENTQKRHLWPGLNTVGVRDVSDRPSEIVKQINISRNILKNSEGTIHWSIAGLNPSMLSALKNGPYKEKALIPATNWVKTEMIEKPSLEVTNAGNSVTANWSSKKLNQVTHWILYAKYGENWETEILDSATTSKSLTINKSGKKLNAIAIKAVDRLGNESLYDAKIVK